MLVRLTIDSLTASIESLLPTKASKYRPLDEMYKCNRYRAGPFDGGATDGDWIAATVVLTAWGGEVEGFVTVRAGGIEGGGDGDGGIRGGG